MKKTKKFFNVIKIAIMFFTVLLFGLLVKLNVFAADDYPDKYKNAALDAVVDEWNFYNRECTSFVAWCLNSRNGIPFTNHYGGYGERWGHAKDWGSAAATKGFTVDNNPAVGAVAWSNSGKYGHVAWVAAVNGDYITIEEYNADEKNPGRYNTRQVHRSAFTGYIHLADIVGESGQEMTSGYDRILPDGDYLIGYAGTSDKSKLFFLDIYGTDQPAAASTNVDIAGPTDALNIPSYEVWTIKYSNGFYTICQKKKSGYTGKDLALDVQGASKENGANVMVSTFHGGSNQQWAITYNGNTNGYRIKSKVSGYSLDVQNGLCENANNVRVWKENTSDAQSWLMIPYQPAQPISNGKYIITSTVDENYVMSIAGNEKDYSVSSSSSISVPQNTNIQIGKITSSNKYNEFELTKLENGFYKIIHVASGLALDLQNGTSTLRSNVALHTDNGSIAQQWAIIPSGKGYYFVPRCSGLTLDLENASTVVGTNISQWYPNFSAAEIWKFVPAEYTITYNMNGGSGSISSQKKYHKNSIKLSTTKPTKSGAEFLGWSTDKNATKATYQPGGVFSTDANTTLYAIWTKEGEVVINATNFPDSNFRPIVLEKYDTDKNGILSQSEINSLSTISLSSAISNFKGLEYFTAVKDLTIQGSNATSLDLSKNTALEKLNVRYNNYLKILNISNNTELTYLDCRYNALSGLNVTNNDKLITLDCRSNQIKELNVSNNTGLKTLYCDSNKITSLDVKACSVLEKLGCSSNQLTELDVQYNSVLKMLGCESNSLLSLDVSNNPDLYDLTCYNNQIETLDIRNNPNLKNLYLTGLVFDYSWEDFDVNTMNGWTGVIDGQPASFCVDKSTELIIENLNAELSGITNSRTGVALSWIAPNDKNVAKYRVLRKEGSGSYAAIAKVSGTTYTDKTAEAGKVYTYTIRYMNATGEYVGNYDTKGKSILVVSADSIPYVELTNSENGVVVTWNAVEGAAKYRVLRKEGDGDFVAVAKVAGTKYTDKNAEAGKTYTYTVRPMDESGAYVGVYDKIGMSITVAEKIAALEVEVSNTDDGVVVTWNAVSGASKYRVLRKEGDGSFVAIAKVTKTTYTDKSIEAGKTYTYTVRCMDAEGKYIGSYDKTGKSVTIEALIKAEFSVDYDASGVKISWDAIDGVAKYRVLRKAEGESSFTALAKVSGTSYTDKTAEVGKTYIYTVRCMNAEGKYIGIYDTNGKSITIEALVKAEFTVEYGISGVKISWNEVDGAAKYRVLRKAEGESGFTALAKVSGTSYTDKTAEAGKTYTYTVRCMDAEGKYIGTYDTTGISIDVPYLAEVEDNTVEVSEDVEESVGAEFEEISVEE